MENKENNEILRELKERAENLLADIVAVSKKLNLEKEKNE